MYCSTEALFAFSSDFRIWLIFLGNFSKRVMRVLGLLGKDMLTVMKGADGEGWKGFGASKGGKRGWWRYIGSLTAYLTSPRVKFEV